MYKLGGCAKIKIMKQIHTKFRGAWTNIYIHIYIYIDIYIDIDIDIDI